MALNLLQICTRALDEIGSFNVPTFIVDNEDDTAKQLLAIANKVGEELVRDYDWQELIRTATVTTSNGDSLYPVESDYERVASDTMWDTTANRRMMGNTTKRLWAAVTSSDIQVASTYWFRLRGSQVQLTPTPTSAFTFTYEYLSKRYCTNSGGTEVESWMADTDLPILPADLFIAGIRYYFLKANNLPYGDAEAEYDAIIESRQGKNVPSPAINMAAGVCPPNRQFWPALNIPERIES